MPSCMKNAPPPESTKAGGAVDSFLLFLLVQTRTYEHTHPPFFPLPLRVPSICYSTGLIHAKPAQCYYCSHCWMRELGSRYTSFDIPGVYWPTPAGLRARQCWIINARIVSLTGRYLGSLTSKRTNHRHVECSPRVSTVRALASHLVHPSGDAKGNGAVLG